MYSLLQMPQMNHEEQMQFFYEIFDPSLPRFGPGDSASTRKALDMALSAAPETGDASGPVRFRVLDIGCGNGAQTIELARQLAADITAVDNHQPFLDELRLRAEAASVSRKITTLQRDMRALGMEGETFDLIWSEGALYSMGFQEGLKACYDLLAPGGILAVSELCWLRPDPPAECQRFFAAEYPAITGIDQNLEFMKACGYEVIGHFSLPSSSWLQEYYLPLEESIGSLRERYTFDAEKTGMLQSLQAEIAIYRKYHDYYGYVFYVMARP